MLRGLALTWEQQLVNAGAFTPLLHLSAVLLYMHIQSEAMLPVLHINQSSFPCSEYIVICCEIEHSFVFQIDAFQHMQHFVQTMQQQAQHAIATEDQQHRQELHKLMAR